MNELEQIQANYTAYLAQCKEKNITPNPDTAEAVKRITALLTPPPQVPRGHKNS